MAPLLIKTCTVLDFVSVVTGPVSQATFAPRVNDGEDARDTTFTLDHAVWLDMGEPQVVTLTVEPGDLLNVDEDEDVDEDEVDDDDETDVVDDEVADDVVDDEVADGDEVVVDDGDPEDEDDFVRGLV